MNMDEIAYRTALTSFLNKETLAWLGRQCLSSDCGRPMRVPGGMSGNTFHPDSIPGLLATASARMARENGEHA